MYKSRKSCDAKWFLKRIVQLFKRRYTPAELFQKEKGSTSSVSIDSLRLGAERQWKRIHDPDFQRAELMEMLDQIVPPRKPGSK